MSFDMIGIREYIRNIRKEAKKDGAKIVRLTARDQRRFYRFLYSYRTGGVADMARIYLAMYTIPQYILMHPYRRPGSEVIGGHSVVMQEMGSNNFVIYSLMQDGEEYKDGVLITYNPYSVLKPLTRWVWGELHNTYPHVNSNIDAQTPSDKLVMWGLSFDYLNKPGWNKSVSRVPHAVLQEVFPWIIR